MSTNHSVARGYVAALAATAAWSSSGIFIALLTGAFGVPPLAVAFWRNVVITLALFTGLAGLARRQLRVVRSDIPMLLVFGVTLGVLNGTYPPSVTLNGAAVATVLIYSAPLFSAVAGRILLGEELGAAKAAAVVAGIAGCVLVAEAYDPGAWRLNRAGIVFGLGTGLSFAAYGLVGRTIARRGTPTWTSMAYGFLASTTLMGVLLGRGVYNWLPGSMLGGALGQRQAALGWATLLALALGPTLVGHGLYNVSLVHLPAATATLVVTLEPPLTALLAYVLLGERLGWVQLAGSALVLAGVVAVSLSDRRAASRLKDAARRSGDPGTVSTADH